MSLGARLLGGGGGGRLAWCLLALHLHLSLVRPDQHALRDDVIPHIYEPTWMYKCVPDEGCQRTQGPRGAAASAQNASSLQQVFESLDVCRTVCGRFGGLWPRPATAVLSSHTVAIHPNHLRFDLVEVSAGARELVAQMTQLVAASLAAECAGTVTRAPDTPLRVYIAVRSDDTTLHWDTDEQYTLDVQTKGSEVAVHISAETAYGARHALETFTQLAAAERRDHAGAGAAAECGLRLVGGAKIRDRPVYRHRGFMLDCSRHFIPLEDIKRTLRGMAAVKMNVFHWHVTDSHSFPLESARVPQFTRYGAYSPEELYSTEEVRDLIQYARVRGIRVIIEIDSPAHAGNGWQWGKEYGLGELAVCVNAKPWRPYCIQPPCGQLNPANPATYRVLQDLYRDIADLLHKPALLHVGGDEVFFSCWNSSQEILAYMSQRGFDTTSKEGFIQLWAEFHQTALQAWDEVVQATGAPAQSVMVWSSELTQLDKIQQYLNKDRYVIEVWEPMSSPLLMQLVRAGYRTVSAPKDVWYLDHGFWGNTRYSNWRRMYSHTLPTERGVLGGEVAMWTEYVDEQSLDARVWPRVAAVAERLWSDPASSVHAAEPRLQRLRGRLRARGLRPDALAPAWCAQHDNMCL